MRIRVIDLETTGEAPPEAGVCEIGWCDLTVAERDLLGEPFTWTVGMPQSVLVNPGVPITPVTSAIHHIIDEDVAGCRPWREALPEILRGEGEFPAGEIVALAAHSAKFERQFCTDDLTGGLPWCCTYKGALRLWPEAPGFSNQALRYWRKPVGLRRDLALLGHKAGPDAYVTAFHLRDQLEELARLAKPAIATMTEWATQPALQTTCQFGKTTRGTKWREVETSFLYWCLDKDFDEDVLFTVRFEIDRREKELHDLADAPVSETERAE